MRVCPRVFVCDRRSSPLSSSSLTSFAASRPLTPEPEPEPELDCQSATRETSTDSYQLIKRQIVRTRVRVRVCAHGECAHAGARQSRRELPKRRRQRVLCCVCAVVARRRRASCAPDSLIPCGNVIYALAVCLFVL